MGLGKLRRIKCEKFLFYNSISLSSYRNDIFKVYDDHLKHQKKNRDMLLISVSNLYRLRVSKIFNGYLTRLPNSLNGMF